MPDKARYRYCIVGLSMHFGSMREGGGRGHRLFFAVAALIDL
jgi:hypothetical protein